MCWSRLGCVPCWSECKTTKTCNISTSRRHHCDPIALWQTKGKKQECAGCRNPHHANIMTPLGPNQQKRHVCTDEDHAREGPQRSAPRKQRIISFHGGRTKVEEIGFRTATTLKHVCTDGTTISACSLEMVPDRLLSICARNRLVTLNWAAKALLAHLWRCARTRGAHR